MCGIVGIVNRSGTMVPARKLIEEMLIVDVLRGKDSTGIFTVGDKKEVNTYKKALNASDFMQMRGMDSVLSRSCTRQAIIGHNRSATKGSVSDDMAHPFTYGNITLVHNGTLNNHRFLHKDTPNFVSDSEALCWTMNHIGARETLEKASGSFSVIWYDSEEDTINFCRNEDRPMSMAIVDEGKYLVVASESKMLQWILYRNKMVLDDNVFYPLPGHILSYKLNEASDYSAVKINLLKPYIAVSRKHPIQPTSKTSSATSSPIILRASRIERMESILLPFGKKLYDDLIFWGDKFTPYHPSGSVGKLEGYDEYCDVDIKVISHNINKAAVINTDSEFSSYLYTSTIKAASKCRGSDDVIINVDRVQAISFEEYYKSGTIKYVQQDTIQSENSDYGSICSVCGVDTSNDEVGHLPINSHVTGIKDMSCCLSCASVIQKQNSPNWDSLLDVKTM